MQYVNITRFFHKLVSPSLQLAFIKVGGYAHNSNICFGKLVNPQKRMVFNFSIVSFIKQ